MANLQVKNVPADLHRKVSRLAKRRHATIRDLVLEAVRTEVRRDEFRERLARRDPTDLRRPAARTLEEVRAEEESVARR